MSARDHKRLPNYVIGLISIALIFILFYLAFTKSLPWSGGYEVSAVVKNAQNIAIKSPVRIAGVEVGKVTKVESVTNAKGEGEQAAIVHMEIKNNGRPLHTDAKLQLRPRLFLEGNLFVDLQPGSPSAPEAENGFQIPIQHTSSSVQLDQVLTSLQSDTRQDLQVLLKELGDGFIKYGGANGLREFFKSSAVANKSTSEVSQSLLGTEPHDLSELVVNLDRTIEGLGRNEEQLKGLVTSLSIVTGSFAAQSKSLETAIHVLPEVLREGTPALVNLNRMFPPLRAFSREALPGARSAGPALDAANPWILQLRKLLSKSELRGLVKDLKPVIPQLAQLTVATPPFLEQARALSSCFANVIVPWGNDSIQPLGVPTTVPGVPPTGLGTGAELSGIPVYKETGYGLVGLAGESRSGDANGEYIRVEAGGGTNTVIVPAEPAVGNPTDTFGITPYQLLGYEPAIGSSAKTPYRPDIPCETQQPPNLGSGGFANPPTQMSRSTRVTTEQKSGIQALAKGFKDVKPLSADEQELFSTGSRSRARTLSQQIEDRFKGILKVPKATTKAKTGGGGK